MTARISRAAGGAPRSRQTLTYSLECAHAVGSSRCRCLGGAKMRYCRIGRAHEFRASKLFIAAAGNALFTWVFEMKLLLPMGARRSICPLRPARSAVSRRQQGTPISQLRFAAFRPNTPFTHH